jgi:hypothetical protein
LLVAGIIILVVSSLPFGIGCGLGVYNCGSYVQLELQNFEYAIALLVVSAIVFLYSALTTKGGTAS